MLIHVCNRNYIHFLISTNLQLKTAVHRLLRSTYEYVWCSLKDFIYECDTWMMKNPFLPSCKLYDMRETKVLIETIGISEFLNSIALLRSLVWLFCGTIFFKFPFEEVGGKELDFKGTQHWIRSFVTSKN